MQQLKTRFRTSSKRRFSPNPTRPTTSWCRPWIAVRAARTSSGLGHVECSRRSLSACALVPRRRRNRGEGHELSPLQKRAERPRAQQVLGGLNLVSLIDFSPYDLLPPRQCIGGRGAAEHQGGEVAESGRKDPEGNLVVLVSNQDIVVQGRKVSSVSEAMKADSDLIAPLKARARLSRRAVSLSAGRRRPGTRPSRSWETRRFRYRLMRRSW